MLKETKIFFINYIGRSGGHWRRVPNPLGPFFFQFCAILGEKMAIIIGLHSHLGVGALGNPGSATELKLRICAYFIARECSALVQCELVHDAVKVNITCLFITCVFCATGCN